MLLCLLWFLTISRLATGNLSFPEDGTVLQVCGFSDLVYRQDKQGPVSECSVSTGALSLPLRGHLQSGGGEGLALRAKRGGCGSYRDPWVWYSQRLMDGPPAECTQQEWNPLSVSLQI